MVERSDMPDPDTVERQNEFGPWREAVGWPMTIKVRQVRQVWCKCWEGCPSTWQESRQVDVSVVPMVPSTERSGDE